MIQIRAVFGLAAMLLFSIAFTSCIKSSKPKKNFGNYKPPVDLSDYCFFKPGTYWVYQDSLSGAKDSVYVLSGYMQSYIVNEDDNDEYTGTFHIYYTKTIDAIGDTRDYSIHDETAAQSCCNGRYSCNLGWNRPSSTITPHIALYTHMFNEFTNGATGGYQYGDPCVARGKLSSVQINNNTFNDIVIFENAINIQNITSSSIYRFRSYISKDIGVIKRVDLDSNRTWLIKNYHIVK